MYSVLTLHYPQHIPAILARKARYIQGRMLIFTPMMNLESPGHLMDAYFSTENMQTARR